MIFVYNNYYNLALVGYFSQRTTVKLKFGELLTPVVDWRTAANRSVQFMNESFSVIFANRFNRLFEKKKKTLLFYKLDIVDIVMS